MKRILFVVISIVVLAGCGGDNDDPQPTNNTQQTSNNQPTTPQAPVDKIIGMWNSVSTETTMTVNGKDYGQYLKDEFGLSDDEVGPIIELMKQALTITGNFTVFEVKADGTWHGVTDFQNVHTDVTGKWKVNSDETTLTLTNNAQPGVEKTATITKLNDTDLWLDIVPTAAELPPNTFMVDGLKYKATAKMVRKK